MKNEKKNNNLWMKNGGNTCHLIVYGLPFYKLGIDVKERD